MGPLRVSAENPRYMCEPDGRVVYLVGSHNWSSVQDVATADALEPFDYEGYLARLQEWGHNFIRLWTWEQARWAPWVGGDIHFHPAIYERTGPGYALDGYPRFDLTRLNQGYFDRLRERVAAARNLGFYVSVMLFQGWSVGVKEGKPGNPWLGHPFNRSNNVNGIDGDVDGDGSGTAIQIAPSTQVLELQHDYVRRVVDTVNDLDNVLYEVGNECDGASMAWQNAMVGYVKAYEATRPCRHPVGITVAWPQGDNSPLLEGPADWISPNNGGDYMTNPPPADGTKVIITDTDHLWGEGGDDVWVWRSFLRGLQPIYMDSLIGDGPDGCYGKARWAMGDTLRWAARMRLATTTPRGELASTGYCLSDGGGRYLVFQPGDGGFTVDLTASPGTFDTEWFSLAGRSARTGPDLDGGDIRHVSPPEAGPAVLFLRLQ